jgi:transcription antitermination factor NusG
MKRSIVHWYAARVKYQTEKKIKTYLEEKGILHYIPLQEEKPAIPGLVFICTDYEQALSLPAESGFSISYLYDSDTKKLQIIPDKQMQDFMFLHHFSENTFKLEDPGNLTGGDKVRVIKGDFTGIEGELYRIRGHRRVVVRLEGLMSLATTYIPKECLVKI